MTALPHTFLKTSKRESNNQLCLAKLYSPNCMPWFIGIFSLFGLLAICHAANRGYACRDYLLCGVRYMLVCHTLGVNFGPFAV